MNNFITLISLAFLFGCSHQLETRINCNNGFAFEDRTYVFKTGDIQIIADGTVENYKCEITPQEDNVIKCTVYSDFQHVYILYNKLNKQVSDKRVFFDSSRLVSNREEFKGICKKV
tara:strand:+ start:122 stop:469 length:348 start_codon:yes stop_codon:yes gene_type:complete